MSSDDPVQFGVRKTVLWLCALLVAMVIFTVALIPLYRVFCDWFGINGKVSSEAYVGNDLVKVSDRQIDMQFITQIGPGLPVNFTSTEYKQDVFLGSRKQVNFKFQNLSKNAVNLRAVPSVSPAEASQYLLKIECFCFQEMTLESNEILDVPLIYLVSTNIPDHLKKITLSYQLYPVNTTEI